MAHPKERSRALKENAGVLWEPNSIELTAVTPFETLVLQPGTSVVTPGGVVAPSGVSPFDQSYVPIVWAEAPLGGKQQKAVQHGQKRTPRRCRFCHRSEPAVSFKSKAHVLPQGLGNRAHLTWEECDECNQSVGSPLEDDLLKFLGPHRSMMPFPTKAGGSKHKTKRSSIASKSDGVPPITVSIFEGDPSVKVTRLSNHRLQFEIDTQPYRPMGVAKAVARMALALMPKEKLDGYDYVREWVRGEVETKPRLTMIHIPGPGAAKLGLWVFEQREQLIGQSPLVACLYFGGLVLFWHAPTPSLETPPKPLLPRMPPSPYPPHVYGATSWIVTSDAKIAPKQTIEMGYGSMTEQVAKTKQGP